MTEIQLWTEYMEEFLDHMTDSFRKEWALDAESCPDGWQELSEDSWRLAKHVDQITPLLLRYATDLCGADRELLAAEIEGLEQEDIVLTWNPILVDPELPGLYQPLRVNARAFLRHSITVWLAEQEVPQIPAMAERAIELLKFVSQTKSEMVRAYLSRVSECYVRGMATEGVVMCRSVLEAALSEFLDFGELVATGYIRNEYSVCLSSMLDYVRDESDLPHDVWKAANEVRLAGNTALHSAPGIEDLGTVLKHLTVVLDALAEEETKNK